MYDKIIYKSKSSFKSIWQEYRIYDNRLEFDTYAGLMQIPFEQIKSITVSESEIKGLLKGDLHLKDFKPALKLDWANFVEHVVLDKNTGKIKRLLFTPDDPQVFKTVLEETINDFHQIK